LNSLHRVKVLGREVQVRSTAAPEQVREVEALVNDSIDELRDSMNTQDSQLVAILALLNLGESVILQARETARTELLVRERVSCLINRIEEAVRRR